MSTAFKQIFEQVNKLSRTEQLLLISSIAQLLSSERVEKTYDNSSMQPDFISEPFITKGDKNMDPKGLFGIWESRPRNIQAIRKKAWERN